MNEGIDWNGQNTCLNGPKIDYRKKDVESHVKVIKSKFGALKI